MKINFLIKKIKFMPQSQRSTGKFASCLISFGKNLNIINLFCECSQLMPRSEIQENLRHTVQYKYVIHLAGTKLPTVSLPQCKISVTFPNSHVNKIGPSTNTHPQINENIIMLCRNGFLSLQISREEKKYQFV